MNFILICFFSALVFYLGTTYFLPSPVKKSGKILLFLYLFCIYFLINTFFDILTGQLAVIPLILGSEFIIYIFSDQKLLNITFSLLSYIWYVFANHIVTIPLSYLGISISIISEHYAMIFLCCFLFAIIISSHLIKRYFLNHIFQEELHFPPHLQTVLFVTVLLSTCCIVFNIIYGSLLDYPSSVLTFNGILFGFSFFTMISMLLFAMKIMQKDYEVAMKQKEQTDLTDYMTKIETLYQEMRIFRHDYINILSTMNCYIENENILELKNYFHEHILPTSKILTDNDLLIGKLGNIKVIEIKGLLYSKLITAINMSLNITLEIREPIDSLSMNIVDLSRVLGILLDNALEAASDTEQKKLSIAFIHGKNVISIFIDNSTLPLPFSFSQLGTEGVTAKSGHSGIGLFQVSKILENYPNVLLSTSCQNELFSQKLDIFDCTISNETEYFSSEVKHDSYLSL